MVEAKSLLHFGRRAARSVWFRLAVTVVLLGVVLLEVDWDVAVDRIDGGEWQWFLGAVSVLEVAFLVGAIRWFRLLLAAGIELSFAQTLRAYMIGMFTNNFLPTGFGGDATRAILVGRPRSRLVAAITSVLTDRVTSVACLIVVAWLAVVLDPSAIPRSLTASLVAVTAAGVIAAVVAAVSLVGGARRAHRLPARLGRWLRESHGTCAGYARDPGLVGLALVLGVTFQILTVTASWLLARSLGADLPFALLAVVAPTVLLATVLPISIAGFGVREGSYVVLLGAAGVSHTDATLLSLLTGASLAVASLTGAVALLVAAPNPRAPVPTPSQVPDPAATLTSRARVARARRVGG